MQPLYSKITHLESITFCGGLSYGSNRAGIGADRVAPLDMEGGMSETSTASAPFSSNVMMHGQSQAGRSVVEGFCALYSARQGMVEIDLG